jgi:phosphoribosyl 1,2-cyclic phosphodiesterase
MVARFFKGVTHNLSRFYSLCSGSKGNSSLIRCGGNYLLIDAGASCKQIITAMTYHNLDPFCIAAILVTHTHVDHIRGLRVLCKKLPYTKVYGSFETLQTLLKEGHVHPNQIGFPISDKKEAHLGSYTVKSFPTDHDAEGSCGYRIYTEDDRRCAVCTDLGHVTEEVHAGISGCDLVMLEANYDPDMLHRGRYPASLKRRIAGEQGHLSNGDCAQEAVRLVETGTSRLVLAHLSEENNTPTLASQTVHQALMPRFLSGVDYLLYVAPPLGLKEAVIF